MGGRSFKTQRVGCKIQQLELLQSTKSLKGYVPKKYCSRKLEMTQNISTILASNASGKQQTVVTVFPHIRPAGIIFLQGLQLRVLLECGYYSRACIILKRLPTLEKVRGFSQICMFLITPGTINCKVLMIVFFFQ